MFRSMGHDNVQFGCQSTETIYFVKKGCCIEMYIYINL